mmetsp:Transcript_85500/g.151272  ORF Transcript_85500/g.151272 Transcript_85500/m.151272 type:complete len:206 (+) Transcript_85500:1741-2358(+)
MSLQPEVEITARLNPMAFSDWQTKRAPGVNSKFSAARWRNRGSLPLRAATFAFAMFLPSSSPTLMVAGSMPACIKTESSTSYGQRTSDRPKTTSDLPLGLSIPSHSRTEASPEWLQTMRCRFKYSSEIATFGAHLTRSMTLVQTLFQAKRSSLRCLISNSLLPVPAKYSKVSCSSGAGNSDLTTSSMATVRSSTAWFLEPERLLI